MEMSGQLQAPAALHVERALVPTGQETEWTSEQVWTRKLREKEPYPLIYTHVSKSSFPFKVSE
jgi:hypothetical protein